MDRILAIVVTHNGKHWVERCFGSLMHSSLPLDILVIDNSSTDGTPSFIGERFPQVEVIEAGKNLGFGKANNVGLKKCLDENYHYAFLLNQDAWVESTTIENLIYCQKKNERIGIAVPLQLTGRGDKLDGLFSTYSLSENESFMFAAANSKIQPDLIFELSFANAACWLVPVNILKSVGGFDPLFPHYGEDTDFIFRIKRKGYIVALCPNEKVYHDREHRSKEILFNKESNATFVRVLNMVKERESNSLKSFPFLLKMVYVQLVQLFFFYNKKYYLGTTLGTLKALMKLRTARRHVKQEEKSYAHYLS